MNCCCPCGADKKTAICAYLREHHTGKSRAIHSKDLQRLFCLDGRNIRRKISALRQADQCEVGLAVMKGEQETTRRIVDAARHIGEEPLSRFGQVSQRDRNACHPLELFRIGLFQRQRARANDLVHRSV